MKRYICLLCVLALCLSACSVSEQISTTCGGSYDYGIYELTFKTKKISNHCVGLNWSFAYTYQDEIIKSGFRIPLSLTLFMFLPIDVEVRENDKIDDVGTGRLYVPLYDGGSCKTEITVMEMNGRYKGNTAIWEIACEVKMVGKQ